MTGRSPSGNRPSSAFAAARRSAPASRRFRLRAEAFAFRRARRGETGKVPGRRGLRSDAFVRTRGGLVPARRARAFRQVDLAFAPRTRDDEVFYRRRDRGVVDRLRVDALRALAPPPRLRGPRLELQRLSPLELSGRDVLERPGRRRCRLGQRHDAFLERRVARASANRRRRAGRSRRAPEGDVALGVGNEPLRGARSGAERAPHVAPPVPRKPRGEPGGEAEVLRPQRWLTIAGSFRECLVFVAHGTCERELGVEQVLVQRVVPELGDPTRRGEDGFLPGEKRHGEPHPRVARAPGSDANLRERGARGRTQARPSLCICALRTSAI